MQVHTLSSLDVNILKPIFICINRVSKILFLKHMLGGINNKKSDSVIYM